MSKRMFGMIAVLAIACMTLAFGGTEAAFAGLGQPTSGELGLQASASPIMDQISSLFHVVNTIIIVITLFVLVLMLWVMFRFNEKRNPVPSKTAHNTLLEVVWTVVPALILVFIAVFSFPLLYKQLDVQAQNPELTIRAIGHQWYWSYEYPDNGNFTFDARVIRKEDIQPGQTYLLDTDNEVVLPAGVNIRIQVTAADVIHSWTVPSFGVKHDGVPGKVNESWFNITEPGIYYGQCSELCGVEHAYMPIKIHAVTKEAFQAWVAEAQQKFDKVEGTASLQDGTQDVAAAQ